MTALEEMMAMVKELEAVDDVTLDVFSDDSYGLTFNDFGGFDEDWCEIDRGFVKEDLVDRLLDWLEESSISDDGAEMYRRYQFDGFSVEVAFASYDI